MIKQMPLTKEQVAAIKPSPRKLVLTKKGKLKKEWSFEVNSNFVLPEGTIEVRRGGYVPKIRR